MRCSLIVHLLKVVVGFRKEALRRKQKYGDVIYDTNTAICWDCSSKWPPTTTARWKYQGWHHPCSEWMLVIVTLDEMCRSTCGLKLP